MICMNMGALSVDESWRPTVDPTPSRDLATKRISITTTYNIFLLRATTSGEEDDYDHVPFHSMLYPLVISDNILAQIEQPFFTRARLAAGEHQLAM